MTDGFFTRPGSWLRLLYAKIAPDTTIIQTSLKKAGIKKLDAVLTVHSHYDHAMDSPEVVRLTGADLLGSKSTANIGRGWGLPEKQIKEIETNRMYSYGKFRITFIESRHVPLPSYFPVKPHQTIDKPLVPPAKTGDYAEGGTYSILIEHPKGNILIQGLANYLENALKDYKADVVFLGIAGLAKQSKEYQDAYFEEVVLKTGAKRIIPIHWDDFTIPLDQSLKAIPILTDHFGHNMEFIEKKANEHQIKIQLMQAWDKMGLFE